MEERLRKFSIDLGFDLSSKQAELLWTPNLLKHWTRIVRCISPLDYEKIRSRIETLESNMALISQKQGLESKIISLEGQLEEFSKIGALVLNKRYQLHSIMTNFEELQSKLSFLNETIADLNEMVRNLKSAFVASPILSDLESKFTSIQKITDIGGSCTLNLLYQSYQDQYRKESIHDHVLGTLKNKKFVSMYIPQIPIGGHSIKEDKHLNAVKEVEEFLSVEKSKLVQKRSGISAGELEFTELRSEILNSSSILHSKVMEAVSCQLYLTKRVKEVVLVYT